MLNLSFDVSKLPINLPKDVVYDITMPIIIGRIKIRSQGIQGFQGNYGGEGGIRTLDTL